MKFITFAPDGKWIGGFMCRRHNLQEMLDELRDIASTYKGSLRVVRQDRGIREQYVVEPRNT